jgi:predicted metal-binding membrane protein
VSAELVRRRDLPVVVPIGIGAAWIVAAAVYFTGNATGLRHDKLFHGGPSAPVAIVAFAVGWVLTVVAVLLPSVLPAVRQCGRTTAAWSTSERGPLAFIGGYLAVWVVFGLALLVFDHGVHTVADAVPWLGDRPWLVSAATLLVAGVYELTRTKDRWLGRCRSVEVRLRPAEQSLVVVFDAGRNVGAASLVTCWALMLVMFAEGVADLGVMAALAVTIAYEMRGRHGVVATKAAGAVLLTLAVVTLIVR